MRSEHSVDSEFVIYLRVLAKWSDFARAMLKEIDMHGGLTENQLSACHRMIDKVKKRQAELDAEKKAKDWSGVRE